MAAQLGPPISSYEDQHGPDTTSGASSPGMRRRSTVATTGNDYLGLVCIAEFSLMASSDNRAAVAP